MTDGSYDFFGWENDVEKKEKSKLYSVFFFFLYSPSYLVLLGAHASQWKNTLEVHLSPNGFGDLSIL